MSDTALNRFRDGYNGDSAHLFRPGQVLDLSLLEMMYGEEGDGTDMGFCQHHDDGDFLPFEDFIETVSEPNHEEVWEYSEEWSDDDTVPVQKQERTEIEIQAWVIEQYSNIIKNLEADEVEAIPCICGCRGLGKQRLASLSWEEQIRRYDHGRRGCGDYRTKPRCVATRDKRKLPTQTAKMDVLSSIQPISF